MTVTTVAPGEARATELDLGDRQFVVRDYYGSFQELQEGVQAFEVHLTTQKGVVPPHYHEVDQYQVVVGGSGTLGKHGLPMGAVHYTDRYTPYGPITAGDDGLQFFTLRLDPVLGSNYMPESRDRKTVRSGATFTGVADLELPVVTTARRELGATDGGARAVELRVAPRDDLAAGGAIGPGYLLVLAGSALRRDAVRPVRTCLLVNEPTGELGATAGPDGCVLAHLAFRDAPTFS